MDNEDSALWADEDYILERPVGLAKPKLTYRREAKRLFLNGLKKQALNELISGLLARRQRFMAFKNHVKAIAIQHGDSYCTITGSANLSAQPRCEQYVLTTSPDVYRFFVAEFFEAMFHATPETE